MWFGCAVNNLTFSDKLILQIATKRKKSGIDLKLEVLNNLIRDQQFAKIEEDIHKALDKYLSIDGEISGQKIMDDYFPLVNADIFISHSHKDIQLAKWLANWLYDKFKIVSFVDSMIWGYSGELLKKIDETYCKNKNENTYSYSLRNSSTAYVYMMLAVSLMKMMNKCTCLFFINTDQSIRISEIDNKRETFSPWIFYELDVFHKLEKRVQKQINFAKQGKISNESILEMSLHANMKDLKLLNTDLLKQWAVGHKVGADAIQELAKLIGPELL